MKIIAYYLPQFYETPQNNKWWGVGFTEWTNTRKAKPLFNGHYQPRTPFNNNYYDLSKTETQKWQIELAKKYGIYGFSYYHYWFKDGNRMLEKPEQNLLRNPELDIPFCLCWANEAWSRRWDGSEKDILMEQDYGDQDAWKAHFDYLLPYFKDKRYITQDGSPVFIFYRPELIGNLESMLNFWNELACINGIYNICFVFQHSNYWRKECNHNIFQYGIETQPAMKIAGPVPSLRKKIALMISNPKVFMVSLKRKLLGDPNHPIIYSYDKIWKTILNEKPKSEKSIPCAFSDWDNSARVGKRSIIFRGSTPDKFRKYLSCMIKRTRDVYHKDMLFINAWNEWAEGAYLEPDEKYQYGYLEAVKNALEDNGYNIAN